MRLANERDEAVALAVALAVRAPRLGSVYVDLAGIRTTATVDVAQPVDLEKLPWPAAGPWVEALRNSAVAGVGDEDDSAAGVHPLRLVDTALYLDRYWREERAVASDLKRLADSPAEGLDLDLLARGIARRFGDESGRDRLSPLRLR